MRHVLSRCRCASRDLWRGLGVIDDDVGEHRSKKMTLKAAERGTAGLGWKTTRDDDREQSRVALPKNLIRPLPVQDRRGEWFRRPALPFAGVPWRSGWRRLRWQRKR